MGFHGITALIKLWFCSIGADRTSLNRSESPPEGSQGSSSKRECAGEEQEPEHLCVYQEPLGTGGVAGLSALRFPLHRMKGERLPEPVLTMQELM